MDDCKIELERQFIDDVRLLKEQRNRLVHQETDEEIESIEENLEAETSLTEEKKENKLENDRRVVLNQREERKRNLYTLYSERAARLHAVEQSDVRQPHFRELFLPHH